MKSESKVVGYVVRKFPVLSETFILNEILALEEMGVTVQIFSLAPTRDPRFHEGVCRLRGDINYVPGADETSALIRHARRQATRNPVRYRSELLKVLSAGRPRLLWRFLQASWVADRARRMGVQHFHAHFANRSATVARQASRLLRVPFSFTAHAFDIYRDADHHVLARKMSEARFTATVSEYNVRFLESLSNGYKPRVELVRNGIDMSRFVPAATPPDGVFRILTVARLVEKKGLAILVEACSILKQRNLEFKCDIIGKGALRAELERMIRELGLKDRVRLLGPLAQQHIVPEYHNAHLVVLPCVVGNDGNRDGLPVSIIEALACGIPVVSTPVTGIPEAVHDGKNGLIIPSGDALQLADAIERVMRNPDLHSKLSAAARPSVLDVYDQSRTTAQLYELFMEAIA